VTGVLVLASLVLLIGGSIAHFASTRDVSLAEARGRLVVIPIFLLWAASAFGLIKGILGLMQPHGKKALAVGGTVLNGLLCVAPLVAILALSR
jgi:hypothetical protein